MKFFLLKHNVKNLFSVCVLYFGVVREVFDVLERAPEENFFAFIHYSRDAPTRGHYLHCKTEGIVQSFLKHLCGFVSGCVCFKEGTVS